ncbi:hypothetical protein PSHT_11414 [Puccinia striiformis]|uniref:Uncharacterized protein n=2 Tax=Puccinia striiformis TaxID=27350 RepID=A0A2S4V3Y5_9BASI
MEPFPLFKTTKLENLHQRFKRACRSKAYRKILFQESQKDLYLNTQAKKFNLQTIVDHPRISLLEMPDNSAPLKLHGTLAVPPSVAQGQILPPTASVNNGAVDEEYSERLQRLVSELDLVLNPT